jgi:hypothetical protein
MLMCYLDSHIIIRYYRTVVFDTEKRYLTKNGRILFRTGSDREKAVLLKGLSVAKIN